MPGVWHALALSKSIPVQQQHVLRCRPQGQNGKSGALRYWYSHSGKGWTDGFREYFDRCKIMCLLSKRKGYPNKFA
jgi:hypothetical protein